MAKHLSTAALAALLVGGFAAAESAHASAVTVIYNTLTSANPDVEGPITGVVTGQVDPTLGPDGLPVASATSGFKDVNSLGELLWWTPNDYMGSPAVIAGTTFPYPSPVTLPFNIPSNFFPNGPSGSDGGSVGYTSAELKGTFVTPSGGSVTFTLGSDDAAWIFLNGNLVVDNGGIHGFSTAPTTVSGLAPGTNTVEVFYADLHTVQAGLYFNASVTVTPTIPETSTWGMMLIGFAGLGYAAFRTRKGVRAPLAA